MMRARLIALIAATTAALLLAGCAGASPDGATPESAADGSRPVTATEAELLAVARFNNFDTGTRPFETHVQERGVELHLQGWVDYIAEQGYASTTGDFDAQALVWTASEVGIAAQEPDADGNPLLPAPTLDDPLMTVDVLTPTSSRLDTLLTVISNLGADRPDNPLLLQQSGALWLRDDTIDGTPVTVFAAPPDDSPRDASSSALTAESSPLRLWVDASGLLLRAEARLGSDWATIDMPDLAGPELGPVAGAQQ